MSNIIMSSSLEGRLDPTMLEDEDVTFPIYLSIDNINFEISEYTKEMISVYVDADRSFSFFSNLSSQHNIKIKVFGNIIAEIENAKISIEQIRKLNNNLVNVIIVIKE